MYSRFHHNCTPSAPVSLLLASGQKTLAASLLGFALLGLQGCGLSTNPFGSSARSGVALQGRVHGGQQPIVNATIQLYAVGQTGVGSPATPLLTQSVTTAGDGGFTLQGVGACPSATVPVYLVSRGGNPGLFTGDNQAIALMAALGPCGNLNQVLGVTINEVTTVAAAFSLAPFMTSYSHVGTDASLAGQFATSWAQAAQLADVYAGTAPGLNAASFAGVVPVAKINSLANIVAACVNSSGYGTATRSLCDQLFADTTGSGVTPTDTVGALLQIARDPSQRASSLFNLLGPISPFEPKLTSAPADWGLFSSVGQGLVAPILPPTGQPNPPPPDPDPAPQSPQLPPSPVQQPTNMVTWYVRADGAPHYESRFESTDLQWRGNLPTHTCDGTHDAPWPAIGSRNVLGTVSDGRNQPCALSDWRNLYDDQYSYGQLNWIIAGGDTVILDNTHPWRVGWDAGNPSGNNNWCWGRDPYGCFNPSIPAGTGDHPTRILGRNYQTCGHPDGSANHAKMSQIFGGFAAGADLNLSGTHDVEVQCVELTQHASCIAHGVPALPYRCNSDYTQGATLDDYAGDGIYTDISTQDILLQNVWVHGMVDRGIIGAVGGLITTRGLDLQINGMAGWDFDPGNAQPSRNAVIIMSHDSFDFAGCNQDANGVVASCYGQNEAGYGDGLGTPGMQGDFYIDHTYFRYNAQDGPDLTHVTTGAGHILSFTNNVSIGNAGAALKWGPAFSTTNLQNNVLIANCNRFAAGSLSGTLPGYNAHFSTFCRASNGTGGGQYNHGHTVFAHNTLVNYFPTSLDPSCVDPLTCGEALFEFHHNIVRGYDNPATYNNGGQRGGPGIFCGYQCDNSTVQLGTFNRDQNWYFGTRHDSSRPNTLTGYALFETATNEMGGVDPQFVSAPTANGSSFSEVAMDSIDTALAIGSPAAGLGASISNVPPTPVSMEASPVVLAGPGATQRLMPVVHFSDYSMLPVKAACVSSAPAVVFVTAPCTLTALAAGDATVTATYATLAPVTVPVSVARVVADDFTGSSLGARWTIDQGNFTTGGGGVSGSGTSYARYTGASFAPDQNVCTTFGATTDSGAMGLAVRWHGDGTGYRLTLSNSVFQLIRQDGPSTPVVLIASPQNTLLGHDNGVIGNPQAGDEMCLRVTGHTLTVFANGLMATTPVDDANYNDGSPALFSEGANTNRIVSFKAYSLVNGPATSVP